MPFTPSLLFSLQDAILQIDRDTDLRAENILHNHDFPHYHRRHLHHHHHHPLHNHQAFGDAPDPDEGDISHYEWTGPSGARGFTTTMRSTSPGGSRMPPGMADAFGPIFGTLMGGMPPPNRERSTAIDGADNPNRGTFGGGTRLGTTYTFSFNGPGSMRWTRTSGTGNVGMDDLNSIMGNIMNMFEPNGAAGRTRATEGAAGGDQQPGSPISNLMRMLMEIGPQNNGPTGDVAYTQEAFDRIITMLREQGDVPSNAPGPASAAAIEALPKIKISKEHLDDEGKADCSICMDGVSLGTEVTLLPCKHWFHPDCVSSWLNAHDTCPQCRRGITPQEGDQDTPRRTGDVPRYWQVNEGDINAIARGARGGNQSRGNGGGPTRGNRHSNVRQSSRTSSVQTPSSGSSRRSSLSSFVSGIGRRFFGGGGNDGGGSRH